MSESGGKSSPAVKVAIISVALSICIMLLAVSVVQGFRREIRDKITGFDAHVTLYANMEDSPKGSIVRDAALDSALRRLPFVTRIDYIASAPVLLKTKQAFKGVYMRGVDTGFDYSFLSSHLMAGRQPDRKKPAGSMREILVSRSTARKLTLHPGDTVNTYLVSDELRARPMIVSGIFDTHFDAYDDYYIYGDIDVVQQMSGVSPEDISAVEITTADFSRLDEYLPQLTYALNNAIDQGEINQSFRLSTVLGQGANYFAWLDLLDTNVAIILVLMTLVAMFTLISGMLIIILEKVRFIGVMRALGLSRHKLRRIFVLLAVRIGLTGLLIGNGVALLIISLQYFFHFIPLDASAYFIDFVPVSLAPMPLVYINLAFVCAIYLVLILPSQMAGRIRPSESMRFD